MRAAGILLVATAMAACSPSNGSVGAQSCPELESLLPGHAEADARAAARRGDSRLLMIGGYVGTIPGAEGSSRPTRLVEGTGDTATAACYALRAQAEKYALTYNRTMIALSPK